MTRHAILTATAEIYCCSVSLYAQGNLTPTNAPEPSMHSLEDIYQRVDTLSLLNWRELSDTTTVVQMGCYGATTLNAVDPDLATENIKTNVTVYGIAGTLEPLPEPQDWLTLSDTTPDMEEGYYGTTSLDAVESDLAAENIKTSIALFGITGTLSPIPDPQDWLTLSDTTPDMEEGYYGATSLDAVDLDLIEENIKVGTTLFGITGTLSPIPDPQDWLTLSDTTPDMEEGYYGTTSLDAVDLDLVVDNIRTNVTIFGIDGTLVSASVPKTGQMAIYASGDDGQLSRGVDWPTPRFTVSENGTVSDNLTGLVWLQLANPINQTSWNGALSFCNSLHTGTYGLTDGSLTGDWRLPNVRELQSLIDYGRYNCALPVGHPFSSVLSYYWSSTTFAADSGQAWNINMLYGVVNFASKGSGFYVWPVRDGQ